MSFTSNGIVTLLSDLGTKDPFVGIMKGIILSRFPQANIVDLCHGVPVQDVAWAAFALEGSYKDFPAGTVHCAVVGHGGQGAGSILVGEKAGHVFVGADNGLLTHILSDGGRLFRVDLDRVPVAPVRKTWHGRDIVAPVGALLASGKLDIEELGTIAEDPVRLGNWPTTVTASGTEGVIVGEDRFGNLFTSIREEDLPGEGEEFDVDFGGKKVPLVSSYSQVASGEMLALFNSFGLLEISVRDAALAQSAKWERGEAVRVTVRPGS